MATRVDHGSTESKLGRCRCYHRLINEHPVYEVETAVSLPFWESPNIVNVRLPQPRRSFISDTNDMRP
jgi:hypothetical protein